MNFPCPTVRLQLCTLTAPTSRSLTMTGRSVAGCRRILNYFHNPRHGSIASNPPTAAQPSAGPLSYPTPIVPPSRKRSAPAEGIQSSYGGRPLMAKPSTASTDPSRPQAGAHPHSPMIEMPQPTGGEHPVRKKRGRPRKAEVEERKVQAERLHQERIASQIQPSSYASPSMAMQSPFASFAPQPVHPGSREAPVATSAPESPQLGDVTSTPRNTQQPEGDVNSSSSSSKKKRGRPPKVDTEAIPPPTFSASASSAAAYGSPPQSGVPSGSISRRLSVSTRSQGTTAGPGQQELGVQQTIVEEVGQQQNRQSRSWNDTVMGSSSSSNNNPNLRQPQP